MKNNLPPYEISQEPGGRPFLRFEHDSGIFAWPWHSLRSLRLSPDGSTLVFEYPEHSVEITGTGLGVIADLASTSRLKIIREGEAGDMQVGKVRLIGVTKD